MVSLGVRVWGLGVRGAGVRVSFLQDGADDGAGCRDVSLAGPAEGGLPGGNSGRPARRGQRVRRPAQVSAEDVEKSGHGAMEAGRLLKAENRKRRGQVTPTMGTASAEIATVLATFVAPSVLRIVQVVPATLLWSVARQTVQSESAGASSSMVERSV